MIGVSQNQSMVKNSLFMTGKEKTGYLTFGAGGEGVGVCVGTFDLFFSS